MSTNFSGTGVALVTPFNKAKKIDFDALNKIVDHVIDGGVEYVLALGTTGENVTLGQLEKKQVVEKIVQFTNKRVPVVVGIGGCNTQEVVDTIQHFDFLGVSAILSVAPYYNKPSQRGLYEHFSAIAKASPLPVILYNVPGRTASNICAETTVKLANDNNNIIGVKEASGNLLQIMQIAKNKPKKLQLISGDDALTYPMLHIGAVGVISVIANSHPKLISDMVRAGLSKNCELAKTLHYKMFDFISALFEEGSPAGVKAALEILGLCTKEVRLPLVHASDELIVKMKNLMVEM